MSETAVPITSLASRGRLRKILDKLYEEYEFGERLKHDPLEFPHRYSAPEDREVSAFIASSFAYGRVNLFKPVVEKILRPGGRHPHNFFRSFTLRRDAGYFKGLTYRFNREKDILCFLYMLKRVLRQWGTLKNLFYHFYKPDHENIGEALNGFANYFLSIDTSPIYKQNIKPPGVAQLLAAPERGSACKRMNLFLRWMVRRNDIDLGIWTKIPPEKLIIPLDTHIGRIARCLGLTDRTVCDWKTAKDITESLKRFDPLDPLKYDFALCHLGITGICRGRAVRSACPECPVCI